MHSGSLVPALPAESGADCPQISTVAVKNSPWGPAGMREIVSRTPGKAGRRTILYAGDCGHVPAFVSSESRCSTWMPVGESFMSLLGAVIAWLLRGLLRRPAPALARSAAGYWAGARLSPEYTAEACAWQHAAGGPL